MSFSLMDSIKEFITADMVSTAASSLDENVVDVNKALDAAIPSLLSGLINKSIVDSTGVFGLVKEASDTSILNDLTGVLGTSSSFVTGFGLYLMSGVFGTTSSTFSNLVSTYAGIKPSAGNTLIASLAPIALAVIGKHVSSNNMDARGLSSLLNAQKEQVSAAIPGQLNLSGLWVDSAPRTYTIPDNSSAYGIPKWALPILFVIASVALLFYMLRSMNASKTQEASKDSTTSVMSRKDTAAVDKQH